MAKTRKITSVNIRPGVSVLSVLSHLNYRPWFALGEFVDNAIQSYVANQDAIAKIDGESNQLRVEIQCENIEVGIIKIRDNAAGISQRDFPRAFRPAQLPPDASGLSEFGMGMKSAACWFAPTWSVRTSAIGEEVEREISFDIEKIVRDEIGELKIRSRKAKASTHFTEIVLNDLHQMPVGRTLGKIKSHLADIYRIFTRDGLLELSLNGEPLTYKPPSILVAPFYKNEKGKEIEWKKEFDFDFGDGLRAHGFAAIRKTASTSTAGFALFRRNRLIVGSADEGYRPEFIFGKPNSYAYQRVFGEIHLEGFDVSHTKDGFQWDENEQPFLEFLKEKLSDKSKRLLQQAREYRVVRKKKDYRTGATQATKRITDTIREHVPTAIDNLPKKPSQNKPSRTLPEVNSVGRREIDIKFSNQQWNVTIELSTDPAVGDWLEISEQPSSSNKSANKLGLRVSLAHPFMERFGGADCDEIEPLLRMGVAIALSEVVARRSGMKMAGTIRRNINSLLREALCKT